MCLFQVLLLPLRCAFFVVFGIFLTVSKKTPFLVKFDMFLNCAFFLGFLHLSPTRQQFKRSFPKNLPRNFRAKKNFFGSPKIASLIAAPSYGHPVSFFFILYVALVMLDILYLFLRVFCHALMLFCWLEPFVFVFLLSLPCLWRATMPNSALPLFSVMIPLVTFEIIHLFSPLLPLLFFVVLFVQVRVTFEFSSSGPDFSEMIFCKRFSWFLSCFF